MGAADALNDLPPPVTATVHPVLELIDRDGSVRQSFSIDHWPLRIGRALDNDIVLGDPHVAAHHLVLDTTESGIALQAGETLNGIRLGRRHVNAHAHITLDPQQEKTEWVVGRTRLRLRLPGQALAPELPLASDESLTRQLATIFVAAAVLIAGTLFTVYLGVDADALMQSISRTLQMTIVVAAVWCGGWALLSKTFAHQARFGWHLRVFLLAGIALLAVDALPDLLAYTFSWPWLSDFSFVGEIVVVAAALYFHLLAVEPARRGLLRLAVATCALVGIGLMLWSNVQSSDMFGEELYMSHLFPPGLRIAKPVAADAFVDGLAPLKATLDKKAREPGRGEDDPRTEDDE
jgi:hypothetical protein